MTTLLMLLALMWVVLVLFLAAWTLWFQAYIYSEAVGQIYWRAPAAGTALTAFFLLWVWLDYSSVPAGRFRGFFEFSSRQDQEPYREMVIENEGRRETYKIGKGDRGSVTYYRDGRRDAGVMPSRPQKIIVTEEGKEVTYEPERDAKGNFKVRGDEPLRYIDKDSGRVMVEGLLGQVSTFRWWWLFQNLFVNVLHFAFWVAALWLLLKFQFWHSFGMGVVAWLAMTIFVLPPLLNRAEDAAKHRGTTPAPAAARAEGPRTHRLSEPERRARALVRSRDPAAGFGPNHLVAHRVEVKWEPRGGELADVNGRKPHPNEDAERDSLIA